MCDRASYMKMTRSTNLMQQLWFIFINTNSHAVHKTTHRLLRTTATTPSVEHHMQQYTTWIPEDGPIDVRNMIINHNYCIKLVLLVIFIMFLIFTFVNHTFMIGDFAKLLKATISFVISVCPSVRPFAWNDSASTRWTVVKFRDWIFS